MSWGRTKATAGPAFTPTAGTVTGRLDRRASPPLTVQSKRLTLPRKS